MLASTPATVVQPDMKPHVTETVREKEVPVVSDSQVPPYNLRNSQGAVQPPQPSTLNTVAPVLPTNTVVDPVVIETIEKDVVVHERIHPIEKAEVQPIIYRERELMEVRQITEPLHETRLEPTVLKSRELPAEVRAVVVERGTTPVEELVIPSTSRTELAQRSTIVNEPIVKERIKRTIIEEIQPVLERDVIYTTIVQHTMPVYEKMYGSTAQKSVFNNTRHDFLYGKSETVLPPPQM